MFMSSIEYLNWSSNKKVTARHETIILQYERFINRKSIPIDKQYWTLAGNQSDTTGNLLSGGELDQIVKTGLIVPSQYYGVDVDKHTYEDNKRIVNGANWILGDFYEEMVKSYNNGKFNVGIVNFDSLNMPCRGSVEFSRIMYFLSVIPNLTDVMLVANFILRQRCVEAVPVEIIEELEKQPQFQFAMKKRDWQCESKVYTYNGSGKTKATWMGSIIFYLK